MSKWRKKLFKEKNERTREATFIEHCKTGNLYWLNEMLTNRSIEIDVQEEEGFRTACYNGQLAVVKYLLTSPKLKNNCLPFANLHVREDAGLRNACSSGNIELVKYLLNSPDLLAAGQTFPNIHTQEDAAFITCCKSGHLELIKYLLTGEDLKDSGLFNIHAKDDWGFVCACANGHLELVKYLTTSPELVEKGYTLVNPDTTGTQLVKYVCANKHLDVLEYLIMEQNLKLTPEINEYLKTAGPNNKFGEEAVLNMFQVSERYHALNNSLEHKQSQKHKISKI